MLRKIRIAAALVCFTLITLLFLDYSGIIQQWFGWLAKVQLFPALLAVNVGVIVFLLAFTLLFGRIYCSVICPLGVFQDGFSWLAGKRKKNRFRYSSAISWLRYGMLMLFIVVAVFIVGGMAWASFIEPYSAYGRIASNLFAPFWRWGNNALAYFAERAESYAFYSVDVWIKSMITFVTALFTFIIVAFLAWRNGRTWCNTVCPIGTVLGFLSGFSLFKPVIDNDKCNSCGLCARNCKASCIDSQGHTIDYTRCVTCMNCIDKCHKKAIQYKIARYGISKVNEKEDVVTGRIDKKNSIENSRRNFLSVTAMFAMATALKAQHQVADGGLAAIEDKKVPKRKTPIMPPGAMSARNLSKHCTACQLCISACPNQILRPSTDLTRLMQPEISYERGYCRPECTRCSEACPTGAIRRITTADKAALQIGRAMWLRDNCVVLRDEVQCTNCERHCPTNAIMLIPIEPNDPDSLKTPAVDTERCIGCGACENLCPARPFSAIYVEGNIMHRTV